MRTSVKPTRRFRSLLRKLSRKFPSVFDELDRLEGQLQQGERPGSRYRRMGGRVYRVRLPNRSARRGKSGGFRVAYYLETETTVFLLAICDRKDCAELNESTLRWIMRDEGLLPD